MVPIGIALWLVRCCTLTLAADGEARASAGRACVFDRALDSELFARRPTSLDFQRPFFDPPSAADGGLSAPSPAKSCRAEQCA